ncbi:MAG: hypothetical protein ACJASQ_001614 [Crocinitomicaceae bacterium]|jgi:hypothetical protein
MKNSNNTVQNILNGYSKWLNKSYFYKIGDNLKKFKSGLPYASYLELAISDLGISPKDFKEYSKPGLLKSFLRSLKGSSIFQQRDLKSQSDIVSAFNAYISYRIAIAK